MPIAVSLLSGTNLPPNYVCEIINSKAQKGQVFRPVLSAFYTKNKLYLFQKYN